MAPPGGGGGQLIQHTIHRVAAYPPAAVPNRGGPGPLLAAHRAPRGVRWPHAGCFPMSQKSTAAQVWHRSNVQCVRVMRRWRRLLLGCWSSRRGCSETTDRAARLVIASRRVGGSDDSADPAPSSDMRQVPVLGVSCCEADSSHARLYGWARPVAVAPRPGL